MRSSSSLRSALCLVTTAALVSFATGCTSTPVAFSACTPACTGATTCDVATATCVPTSVTSSDMAMQMPNLINRCMPACSGQTPYCNLMGQCVQCMMDAQCPLGDVCASNGNLGGSCKPGCTDDTRCPKSDGGAGLSCCTSACVDETSDPANCGGCGTACSTPHATSLCTSGACVIGTCAPNWGDCNMLPADGCESNLHVDPNNCTACGKACSFANAIQGCSDGCYIAACQFGWDDCDASPDNGCETSVLSDPKNCGGCGMPCGAVAHGTAGCLNATCNINSCAQGYLDCNNMAKDGCETVSATDANNCGACGNVCPQGLVCQNGGCTCPMCNLANAKTACINNNCILVSCLQGYADCNQNAADGCEVNTTSDAANCGACGMACPMGQVCSNSVCTLISCMRIGWKTGNADWSCPNGLRLPTVNEYAKIKSCITQADQNMFSYYYDIAVSVGGCNCKWNAGWCGQPSIETINGGRMCGDYQQLQICTN